MLSYLLQLAVALGEDYCMEPSKLVDGCRIT
jgi:hypothetical protein